MATETIVAVFRTSGEAEAVAVALRNAGIAASAIEQHTAEYGHGGADATLATPDTGDRRSGFWAWVLGDDGYVDERQMYEQTMASGGVILSVIVSDHEAAKVEQIIEQHHPVDINEHNQSMGHAIDSAHGAETGAAASIGMASAMDTRSDDLTPAAHATPSAPAAGAASEVIALAEEQLEVGKKVVESGIAKVRRFVVERPVEEQIRLRSETARIERRPVTGNTTVPADAFSEKVIEVRETTEQAVIGKTARVVEEVVIGKDVTERVETVRDTVRREELELVTPSTPGVARPPVAATPAAD